MSRFDNAKQLTMGSNVSRKGGIDNFKVIAPILEGIIQEIENKSTEAIISEFYIGVSGLWGDLDLWPNPVKRFYGQLNYKVDNPESLTSVESKQRMVIGAIKNKWLSTTGVSFKGRFERLKQLGEKNIREDGSTIDTKVVKVGEANFKVVKRMGQKDYKIKGIEESGVAMKYKIVKGKKVFVSII